MQADRRPGTGNHAGVTGVLVLNKPSGITSRKLVDQVARLASRSKVGHAGTLDPLATGILIVCIGPATRLVENLQDLPKTYRTMVRLGARSDTLDADGQIEIEPSPRIPSLPEIRAGPASAHRGRRPETTGVFGPEDPGEASLRPGARRPCSRTGPAARAYRPDRRAPLRLARS